MKLSVIIPCLNAANTIGTQLESLANQKWDELWEVIVCDNGSTDTTFETIKKFENRIAHLRIVDASARKGSAYARNVGAASSGADAIAFCDADDEVGPGWVAIMGSALTQYDFVASRLDVKKLNPNCDLSRPNHPQSVGLQKLWYPPFSNHAATCGLGIKRSIHERVGGFDESLLRLMDTDYCIRVQQKGIVLHFLPEAVVHYRARLSASDIFTQHRLWGQYNTLLYKRYRPAKAESMEQVKRYLSFSRAWIRLILRIPCLLNPEKKLSFLRTLGYLTGVLQGIVKYKVPPV
jgi:glycosyltransferase involved in cell wall biosynthesis